MNFPSACASQLWSIFSQFGADISQNILPPVFHCDISNAQKQLFTLPATMGGLGIHDPIELCEFSYVTSRKGCDLMVQTIKDLEKLKIETRVAPV